MANRNRHTTAYQRAFHAIKEPETAVLMRKYLKDEHFGEEAAGVLAAQWSAANEPVEEPRFGGGVDYSRVEDKRLAKARDPDATSAEAESIFTAVEQLIGDGCLMGDAT